MKIINKVVISKFRSFGENVQIESSDINVFSGGNDSGKSNIIKALNLFFNGKTDNYTGYNPQDDFNKWFRANNERGARDVKIKLFFEKGSYKDPNGINDGFIAERVYGTDGSITSKYFLNDMTELESQTTSYKRADAVTRGMIKFIYIPAIRDSNFRRFIQGELIQITNGIKKLSGEFTSLRDELNTTFTDFGKLIQDKVNISVVADVNFSTLLESMAFATDEQITIKKKGVGAIAEKQQIPMANRGDGIQMQFISFLLWFISATDKSHKYIWGFEEPEVAYEFKKQFEMADVFKEAFSKDAQVFISTHSPAFIVNKGHNVRQYRVYKGKDNSKNRELSYVKDIDKYVDDLFSQGNEQEEQLKRDIWGTNYQRLSHTLGTILKETDDYKSISAALNSLRYELDDSKKLNQRQKRYIDDIRQKLQDVFPEKIFICEDRSAVGLWNALFQKINLPDISVYPSEGCTNDQVEAAIKFKKKERNGYNPKIFRQLDLDGYLPDQVTFLETQMPKKHSKLTRYAVKFLPVNELENFAIDTDEMLTDDYVSHSDQYDNIKDAFMDTARNNLAKIRSAYCDVITDLAEKGEVDKRLFLNKESLMRDEAKRTPHLLLPGKEICKLKPRLSAGKLTRLSVANWPNSLTQYLNSVKTFFDAP